MLFDKNRRQVVEYLRAGGFHWKSGGVLMVDIDFFERWKSMSKRSFAEIAKELECAVALEYKGILFDCWTVDEEYENVWAEMCEGCAEKYKGLLADELSEGGMGSCGVKGCDVVGMDSDYERHYYVDFKLELIQGLSTTQFMERYPELADLEQKLFDATLRMKDEEILEGPDRSEWVF